MVILIESMILFGAILMTFGFAVKREGLGWALIASLLWSLLYFMRRFQS